MKSFFNRRNLTIVGLAGTTAVAVEVYRRHHTKAASGYADNGRSSVVSRAIAVYAMHRRAKAYEAFLAEVDTTAWPWSSGAQHQPQFDPEKIQALFNMMIGPSRGMKPSHAGTEHTPHS